MIYYYLRISKLVQNLKSVLMKSLKSFVMMLGVVAIFASCEKSSDDNTDVGIPSVVLKAEQWKLDAAEANIGDTEVDLLTSEYNIFPACMLDDLISFEEDGTISTDDNILICSEDEVGLIELTGTWSLNEDETVMTIDNGELQMSGAIQVSSNKKINFEFDFEITTGTTVPGKLTLVAN